MPQCQASTSACAHQAAAVTAEAVQYRGGSIACVMTSPMRLSAIQRQVLEQLSTTATSSPRQQQRALIVLSAAEGRSDRAIAAELDTTVRTVRLWRQRFLERGIDGLADNPRSGRPSVFAQPHVGSPAKDARGGRGPRGKSRRPARGRAEPAAAGRPGAASRSELADLPWLPRESVSDITLERLLEAASRTISRRGFASTRVSDIAAEAGVSPAAVHYYFATKDEILVRALLWANARPVMRLEQSTTSGRPVDRLANFIARSIPYPGHRRDEYLLEIDLWSRVRMQPELLPVWESYNDRWTAHLKSILDDGAEDGSFTLAAPADEVAERLVGMTDGLSAQASVGSRRMPHERVRQLVTRFAAEQVGIPVERLMASETPPATPLQHTSRTGFTARTERAHPCHHLYLF